MKNFSVERVTARQTGAGLVPVDADSDPAEINVCYNSLFVEKNDYIQPKVKVEISCLSLDEPFEQREITSFIYDKFKEEDAGSVCEVSAVLPIRTFLEKAFLLNEEYQKNAPRSSRMSRHLYDLEKLMDRFAVDALADEPLYHKIIEHRKKFYHIGTVDYRLDEREYVRICPPAGLYEAY